MSKGLDRQLPADTPEQVGARAEESTNGFQRSVSAHKSVSYIYTIQVTQVRDWVPLVNVAQVREPAQGCCKLAGQQKDSLGYCYISAIC